MSEKTNARIHPFKVWREGKGLTQSHVAERLRLRFGWVGCSAAYISQIESGQRRPRYRRASWLSQLTRGQITPATFCYFGQDE